MMFMCKEQSTGGRGQGKFRGYGVSDLQVEKCFGVCWYNDETVHTTAAQYS